MSTCLDDYLKLDYLNELLSENERARFEEHLAGCPDCRRELDDLLVIRASLASLPRPSAPDTWADAAKDRCREAYTEAQWMLLSRVTVCDRTNIFQYALITACVTAGASLLVWLVISGTIHQWFPGLTTAALGITNPRAARIVDVMTLIFSLLALLFIPSIIDNIYLLVRRRARRIPPVSLTLTCS